MQFGQSLIISKILVRWESLIFRNSKCRPAVFEDISQAPEIAASGNARKPDISVFVEHHVEAAIAFVDSAVEALEPSPTQRGHHVQLLIVAAAKRQSLPLIDIEWLGDDRVDQRRPGRDRFGDCDPRIAGKDEDVRRR